MSLKEDRDLFNQAQKRKSFLYICSVLGIMITFGEALAYVMSGMYGSVSEIGLIGCVIIIA
jgi:protein transport protein SEC61 subunit alpha